MCDFFTSLARVPVGKFLREIIRDMLGRDDLGDPRTPTPEGGRHSRK